MEIKIVKIEIEKEQDWTILPGNSVFIRNLTSKSIADYLFDRLESEIKYIPRGELKFKAPNGQDIPLPRMKQLFGTPNKKGDYPIYRYGLDKYPPTLPWTITLLIIRDMTEIECGQNSNHLVANRYEKNTDYIGYHHDKTNSMTRGSKVIVLSLGETRRMDIQVIYNKHEQQQFLENEGKIRKTKKIASINMVHGSLFELSYDTNKNHKHQIKKEGKNIVKKVRLGLTFRSICEFYNIKSNKYYLEPVPKKSLI
jgi:hypothetical protein